MNNFKASYILDENEILFLINNHPDFKPSHPAQYLIKHYMPDYAASEGVVEGLVNKNLAKIVYGNIVIEPVIDFLAKSVLLSNALWIIESRENDWPVFVLRSQNIYLHIRRYPLIANSWKITPHQNKDALLDEFIGQEISAINRVDINGTQLQLAADEANSWIKGGA